MSMFLAGLAGGLIGAAAVAVAQGLRRRRPTEAELIRFADSLDDVERLWQSEGVGVGYSIDYETGVTDVTIRVPNCGEDVTLRVERPGLTRRRRPITETLGITKELPPSLRGDA